MYNSSCALMKEAIYMEVEERGMKTVADVKAAIQIQHDRFVQKYTYVGYQLTNKRAGYGLIGLMKNILDKDFFSDENAEKSINWLRFAVYRELMRVQNESHAKERDYQHALNIQSSVEKAELNYRKMQIDWPSEEAMEFAIQAKMADIQDQRIKIDEMLKKLVVDIKELQYQESIYDALWKYLADDGYFKKLEEDL